MKSLILFTIFIISIITNAQTIYTKDGVVMGNREDLIKTCIDAAADQNFNIKGLEFDSKIYCSCFIEQLTPNINSWEIENSMKKGSILDLILEEKNWKIMMECFGSTIKVEDDLKLSDLNFGGYTVEAKNFFIKNCVDEIFNEPELKGMFTRQEATIYCDCAFEKLYFSGFNFSDLQYYENENSEIFNEVFIICFNELFAETNTSMSNNKYVFADIEGSSYNTIIPLIDYLGQGYKLKLKIGDVTKYFLLDTGASDLIIDSETERELLLNGTLKRENYLGKMQYELADKKVVNAQLVILNNIEVGTYQVNNVVAAVLEQGMLLCGKSFFDKFRKWEVDFKNKTVTLYK